jgi:hypothetical protein
LEIQIKKLEKAFEKPTVSNPLEHVVMSESIIAFEAPSVFKGEVAFLTFDIEGKKIGELWGTGGKLSFTGDVEASAKVFFDKVVELNRIYLNT